MEVSSKHLNLIGLKSFGYNYEQITNFLAKLTCKNYN